jgi:hypothetical protein
MLETPEQRIKLLKAGFSGKEIERLYIENNNFKMGRNILYEGIEFDIHKLNYQHRLKLSCIICLELLS